MAEAQVTVNSGTKPASLGTKPATLDSMAAQSVASMESAFDRLSPSERSRLRQSFEDNVRGSHANAAIINSAARAALREAERILALPAQDGLLVRGRYATSTRNLLNPELRAMLQRPGSMQSTTPASGGNGGSTASTPSLPAPERTRRQRPTPDARTEARQQERARCLAISTAAVGAGPRERAAAAAAITNGSSISAAKHEMRLQRIVDEGGKLTVRYRGKRCALSATDALRWRDDADVRARFDHDLTRYSALCEAVEAGRCPSPFEQRETAADLVRADPGLAP